MNTILFCFLLSLGLLGGNCRDFMFRDKTGPATGKFFRQVFNEKEYIFLDNYLPIFILGESCSDLNATLFRGIYAEEIEYVKILTFGSSDVYLGTRNVDVNMTFPDQHELDTNGWKWLKGTKLCEGVCVLFTSLEGDSMKFGASDFNTAFKPVCVKDATNGQIETVDAVDNSDIPYVMGTYKEYSAEKQGKTRVLKEIRAMKRSLEEIIFEKEQFLGQALADIKSTLTQIQDQIRGLSGVGPNAV